MKISVAITNHNQDHLLNKTIYMLNEQTEIPEKIYILTDGRPFNNIYTNVENIDNRKNPGRCQNRNSIIPVFLNNDTDALIFIDGDSWPNGKKFISEYKKLFKKYDLIFGTRRHTPVDNLTLPASDLLTGNMDELWQRKPLNYDDLRITSGAIKAWNKAKTFDEKIDLMLTGMIGWSCNFGITKAGLKRHIEFMKSMYNIENALFDSKAFAKGWGYEDVAMGLDSMYAGLTVGISEDVEIMHQSHERTDGLFDHIKGRHLIMDRYRKLIGYKNN